MSWYTLQKCDIWMGLKTENRTSRMPRHSGGMVMLELAKEFSKLPHVPPAPGAFANHASSILPTGIQKFALERALP